MKKLLIAVCLALTVAACASQPTASNAAPAAAKTAGCVPASSPAPSDCKYPGAVYTQKDLQQTGVTGNTAEALRRLDPAITLH